MTPDPEPDGRPPSPGAPRIGWYDGDREVLRPLFAEADDSVAQVSSYLHLGRVLVASVGTDPVGHLQLLPTSVDSEIELKSLAVLAGGRQQGVGRALVAAAVAWAADGGYQRLVVSTATADTGNLRFYQRCGFRFVRVDRDAFGPATGYPDPIVIDGIPLLDRIWLDYDL